MCLSNRIIRRILRSKNQKKIVIIVSFGGIKLGVEDELLEKVKQLEIENKRLKQRLKQKNKRKLIKTTKEEIIDYWENKQYEGKLSVDWSEAGER